MARAIGIDIGGTNTRAALVSAEGKILARVSGLTATSAAAVYKDIVMQATALRDAETVAIGVGIPGRVDAKTGRIMSGGYVDLSGLHLAEQLKQDVGLPAFADNDANMALKAEAAIGAARGCGDVVMLTIGTGIGGAIMSDGQIFHGGGMAGQLGHISSKPDGELCNCGRRGCIETEASGTALGRKIAEAGFPAGTRIEFLMEDKRPEAQAIVDAWAFALRGAVDSLVACFCPKLVLLGGGLGELAAKAVARAPANSPWFQCEVAAAQMGDESGVIGAALAALEQKS